MASNPFAEIARTIRQYRVVQVLVGVVAVLVLATVAVAASLELDRAWTAKAEAEHASGFFQAELAAAEQEIERLERELAARQATVADLQSDVAYLESQLAERDRTLTERDSALAEAESELAERDSALATADALLAELRLALASDPPAAPVDLLQLARLAAIATLEEFLVSLALDPIDLEVVFGQLRGVFGN